MISGVFDFLSNVIFQTCYVGSDGNFPKPLDKKTESELLDKVAKGDIEARDKLIKHNMRLVIHVVKKYNNYYDTDELISVGSLGLIKAVKTYSKGKGTGLATYAARCIENEILMTLRASKKRIQDRSLYEPLSYDKDGNEISFIDIIATDEEGVFQQVENEIMAEKLLDIMKKILVKREFDIVKLRYGLQNSAVYTQIEIANMMNISRSYVSRIEKKALQKIKDYLIDNQLIIR